MTTNDDILFRASVDDRTVEFFDRFDRHLNRIADNSEKAFDNVQKGSKASGVAIGAVAGVVASLTAKLLEMGAAAVSAFTSYVKQATALRARVDTLGITLNLVGQKAGHSAEEVMAAENALKDLGITTSAARQSLILMTRANIDWSEASKLARLAQDSAVVAGLNSSQAFERLIRGIQKGEPELLDELGIQLRRDTAYQRLADSLGKTTKELTDAERSQAILNEIYRQSEVVSGAYAASLGSVGKQATSLPRYMEELQLAIGGAFQEAYAVQIGYMTEKLKEMTEWVKNNEDALMEMGSQLARTLELVFNLIDKVLTAAGKIPGVIESLGVGLAKLISSADDADVEAAAKANVTAERFKQLVSIIYGFFAASFTALREEVMLIIDTLALIPAAVNGTFDEAMANLQERAANFDNAINAAWTNGTRGAAEFLGLIKSEAPEAAAALQEVAESADMEDEVDGSAAALDEVNDALEDLYEKMQEDIKTRAIENLRRQTEEAIEYSNKLQDIERDYIRSVSRMRADFAREQQDLAQQGQEEMTDLMEDQAQAAIDIEEDYQQRLREIQERYEQDASELARQRDAIGLLALMHRHQQEIEQERQAVEERRNENQQSYQERLQELQESLREQEAELNESFERQREQLDEQRAQRLEDLEIEFARKRELQELHDQWEEEDRQRAFEKELADLGEHFAGIEGLTEEGLAEVLSIWEEHLGDLSEVMEEYRALQEEFSASNMGGLGGLGGLQHGSPWSHNPGDLPPGSAPSTPLGTPHVTPLPRHPGQPPSNNDPYTPTPETQGMVYGQAGQISQQLAGIGALPAMGMFNTPRLQAAPPTRAYSEQKITIEAYGLDPLIQRQVVSVLTEVMRNK